MNDILAPFRYKGIPLNYFFYMVRGDYYAIAENSERKVTKIILDSDSIYFNDSHGYTFRYTKDGFVNPSKKPSGVTIEMIADDDGNIYWYLFVGSSKMRIGDTTKGFTETFARKFKEGMLT